MRRAFSFVAALVLAVLPAAALAANGDGGVPFAHPLAVDAKPSTDKVRLGEPFLYTVAITHPLDARYELQTPKDLGAFELLSTARSREDHAKDATTTFTLKLGLYEMDKHPLPNLVFDVVTPNGMQRFELAGPAVEAVSTLPADGQANGAELLDIKGPEDVPVRTYRLLYILAGAAAAGLLGYFIYRALQRRKERIALAPPIVLPLEVRTENALRSLEAEKLPAQGRVREFYFRLSEILRGYLGERYGIEALECTSTELLDRVDGLHVPELPKPELRSFIFESDLVKFAKTVVDESTCQSALSFGYALVQKTRPLPVLPETPQRPADAHGPRLS